MVRNGVLPALFMLLPCGAFAQAEEADPWSGTVSLGFLSTSGNTDTTSFNTAVKVSYEQNAWTHSFNGQANGAHESGMTTAESYKAGGKSAYNFSAHNYVFGEVNWRKDRFSGVDQQLSVALGYGRRFIDTPVHLLSGEIGVGQRSLDFADGTSESGVIGTLGIDYKWTFSETSNFQQTIDVESGSDNTYIETVSAVRARLLGDYALVLSYTIRHNTDVPVGSEKTDRLTAIAIELAF